MRWLCSLGVRLVVRWVNGCRIGIHDTDENEGTH